MDNNIFFRKCKKTLDKSGLIRYYIQVGQRTALMEKSRSWPSAHDWKSCIPQKGIEGSNPSFSAKQKPLTFVNGFLLYFSLRASDVASGSDVTA